VLDAYQLEIYCPCVTCMDSASTCLTWRRVEPYGLVFKGLSRRHIRTGMWYLVAFCQTCQAFEPFRVNAIEQIHQSLEPINRQSDFNLRAYWREARKHLDSPLQTYALTLCVSPAGRRHLGSNIKVLAEQADGNTIIRIELASFDDALSYALKFGSAALVIEPEAVRTAVIVAAQAIAEMYRC
jgi:predicted DNA-binding transcriptional regulator YafY